MLSNNIKTKKRKIRNKFIISTSSLLLLFSGVSFSAKTEYPITIKNCGKDITFTKAPEHVVTVGQNSTEIMYMLGLADHVAGTSLWFSPVMEQFKEQNAKIDIIAENIPTFEGILAKKPDMIANQFEWQIGPVGVVATYEQFDELKVPVYTSPADCAKGNDEGGDGVRKEMFDINLVYQEINDIAKIFDVQDRGNELVTSLKERERLAKEKVASIKSGTSAVFWFSSADLELDPYVAGKLGPAAYIAKELGIKNIIDSDEEWPTVGWETVAKANPSMIVLGEMTRRRFPADDWKVKMEYLKSDPVTSLIPAVKNNYLPVIDVQTMNAGIRTVDGLEQIADALLKYNLAD
ncbi:TPA: ABC transporter substrate-binding protein [Vibrio vulnificus]|nr:ABC transporter substrate-binding protein [Vibrio vulnificus]